MIFGTAATGMPNLGDPEAMGRLLISSCASFDSPPASKNSPVMSVTSPERSRMLLSESIMPGFSCPGSPKRTIFIFSPLVALYFKL